MPLTSRYNKSTWVCRISINFTTGSIVQNNETLVMYIMLELGFIMTLREFLIF